MLLTKKRRPAFRSVEGWARSILLEVGAIRECEEHGWARVLADPHAHERAILAARHDNRIFATARASTQQVAF
jgi:hypothetical protein